MRAEPVGFNFATKPSCVPPLKVGWNGVTVGKLSELAGNAYVAGQTESTVTCCKDQATVERKHISYGWNYLAARRIVYAGRAVPGGVCVETKVPGVARTGSTVQILMKILRL